MSHSSTASAAVSELFRSCYARLVGVVALASGSRTDAEDCVQEAFLKAFDRWEHVSGLESPEAWVRTVAFRLLSNRRRKARNMVLALLRHGPPHDEPSPESDHVDVAWALRQVSIGQRQVVVLHYLLGLGVDEIAQALRIAPGTVKSRLSRARDILGPCFGRRAFMSEISDLLAAEAKRLRPAQAPEFAELLAARARRRRGVVACAAIVIAAAAGGSARLVPDSAPQDRPGVVRRPWQAVPVAGVTVSGTLRQIGGPAGAGPRGIAGVVHFAALDGTVTSVEAIADGRFSLTIPAGRYEVTGTPGGNDSAICRTQNDIAVPAGGLDGVEVNCHVR